MNNNFHTQLNWAYFFLKFRKRTKKEVENYLYKKSLQHKIDPSSIPQVIQNLMDKQYIDDRNFIDSYVQDQTKLKHKSIQYIKNKLLQLGISKEYIEEYFLEHTVNDLETAKHILTHKTKYIQNRDEKTCFKQAVTFLLRKGFSYEVAKKAFEELYENK